MRYKHNDPVADANAYYEDLDRLESESEKQADAVRLKFEEHLEEFGNIVTTEELKLFNRYYEVEVREK